MRTEKTWVRVNDVRQGMFLVGDDLSGNSAAPGSRTGLTSGGRDDRGAVRLRRDRVTNHLRERFGTQKVYLMAHSWGSYIGLQAARRAPELYHAYIGVAQMTHQIRSEALAYEHMLNACDGARDHRARRRDPVALPDLSPPHLDSARTGTADVGPVRSAGSA